ncbi:hypothetical protein NEOLEDRAFT_1148863 [Neolentinus lepideus HHB14362 ss-1]|uniref:F-box domain-containing protein n=1 Tax=Neolentinus lepideus HHB14362 ss-1 TaxID=1314782 RepID=A0A165RU28_9AGAM|nr:hypothetical protein NEOLEDRAFT_1148863 [Neolentinus lepideus HHB14362 ss-1]
MPETFQDEQPSLTTSGVDVLFPEIWDEVFSNIYSDNLANVTLTCRTFRWLAQPSLFKNLIFRVNGLGQVQDPAYLTSQQERLRFITSERIAHGVLHCSIKVHPMILIEPDSISDATRPMVTRTRIVDDIFEVLPAFHNIRSLACESVRINPYRFQKIRQLPSLQHLMLTHCVPSSNGYPPLPLRSLILRDFIGYENTTMQALGYLSLISPEHLQTLRIVDGTAMSSYLLGILETRGRLSLRVLQVAYPMARSPYFTPVLSQRQALEELLICPSDEFSPETVPILPANVLTKLKHYAGPHSLFGALRHKDLLRHVTLWGHMLGGASETEELLELLPMLPRRLESLQFSVTDLSEALYTAFWDHFEGLKNVRIAIYNYGRQILRKGVHNDPLLKALRRLPPSIENIAVKTRFLWPVKELSSDDAIPVAFGANIFPKLRSFFLSGSYSSFFWAPGGSVKIQDHYQNHERYQVDIEAFSLPEGTSI